MGSWGILRNNINRFPEGVASFKQGLERHQGRDSSLPSVRVLHAPKTAPLLAAITRSHHPRLSFPVPSYGHGHHLLSRTLGPYLLPFMVSCAYQAPWGPGGGESICLAQPSTFKFHLPQTMAMVSKFRKIGDRAASASGEGDWHPVGTRLDELGWGRCEGSSVITAGSFPQCRCS